MPPITISTVDSTLAFDVDDAGLLRQLAFGPTGGAPAPDLPLALFPLVYPTFTEDPLGLPALRVTNSSGVLSTRVAFDGHEVADEPDGALHRILLVDQAQPLAVTLCVRTWHELGILEQWVEVTNLQRAPVTLHEVAASAPALSGGDPRLDHFCGGWAQEFTPVHDHLTVGTKVLESRGTTRPNHESSPFLRYSPDGPASETAGVTLAASLAWGGNTRVAFERRATGQVRAWLGHLPTGAEYPLEPEETFTTPAVSWAWSDAGARPLTHRLHRFVRDHVVRDGHRPRAIVANNWEATGFAFDQRRLERFCTDAADVGAELFLLDDGWFGEEFPRDADDAGLGDWVVDRRKLPGGLEALGHAASSAGLRFGVWIEPEMVNPESTRYRAHPDWVVAEEGRTRREERQQLQLDLCLPEVQAFVVGVADGVLESGAHVSYLKWDANRSVSEPGSTALASGRQGRWPVDVVRATWQVMDAVARRRPDVELMLCASGGGRIDLGTLRYFHEVWLSDNTDPVDRVRMQWHASAFLPATVLASHVTLWGMRPIPFACAVAMSARFGFDFNRDLVSDDDWAVCRRAAHHWTRLRDLVLQGRLQRLVSPDEGPLAALAYVDDKANRAVVFGYRLPATDGDAENGEAVTRIRVAGLDEERRYGVAPIDLTTDTSPPPALVDGKTLVDVGLEWPDDGPLTARIWELVARP